MRFASLGSGSSGNCTLIQSGDTILMLDCGFACKETVRRLARLTILPEQISAILVTHEHNDHFSGVGVFSRKFNAPVWMNYGTLQQHKKIGRIDRLKLFNSFTTFNINNFTLYPCVVPHDAREAVQFVFQANNKRLGIFTDLGHITPLIVQHLKNLDALMIEANHDLDMLWQGSYMPVLKKRVASDYGHLNNYQAAQLVKETNTDKCQHLIAGHLSQENNSPEKALQAFIQVLEQLPPAFEIAHQDSGFQWKQIN